MKTPETNRKTQEMANKPNMDTNYQQIKKRKHPTVTKTPTGKCLNTGKVNSIDNQRLIYQNP